MATADWETDPPLIKKLLEQPYLFSFFQAVYLLEKYVASIRSIEPVGNSGPVDMESIRFRPDATLASQVSEVVSVEKMQDRFRLTTSFLGLYGPDSPLPDFYTEDILAADPEESNVKDFLDIFHHRLLSLIYRCWLKYRYYLQYKPGGKDDFSSYIFSLTGILMPEMISHFEPVRILNYVGLMSQQSRSAKALESLLSDYFEAFISIEQCLSRWVTIGKEDRTALGVKNSQLDTNMAVGDRIFDRSGKFRISIYLTKLSDYTKFLPEGDNFSAMSEIIQLFLNSPMDFDEELILAGDEVPMLLLSSSEGLQLGRASWLISQKPDRSVSVIFEVSGDQF